MVGRARQRENDFDFAYLPKVGRGFQGQGYAFLSLAQRCSPARMKGLFCFGQNPAVGAPTRA